MSTFDNVTVNEDINGVIGDYIVEVGENDNGKYIKYNSGRLVMWGTASFNGVAINNNESGLNKVYNSIQYYAYFPINSLTRSVAFVQCISNTGAWVSLSTGTDLTKGVGFWFYHGIAISNASLTVHWQAVGTWK